MALDGERLALRAPPQFHVGGFDGCDGARIFWAHGNLWGMQRKGPKNSYLSRDVPDPMTHDQTLRNEARRVLVFL